MHGLRPQTIESLNLLRTRDTKFIVALNKVDMLYGWKTCKNAPVVKAIRQQTEDVTNEFKMKLSEIITQFKEQGLNTELYYKNKEMLGETFSIVPASAKRYRMNLCLLFVIYSVTDKLFILNSWATLVLDILSGKGSQISSGCWFNGLIDIGRIASFENNHKPIDYAEKGD
ncbi:Transcription factor GTP-binding domain [Arabidopsis suecica]|uniref:Transcription factor GTP-binding domain n=1 Tax=Arabidopsis suecica TaxID=45249 RepID=A0A8T2C4F0_ARASU|nr:Transcription factor GTP-binding domain [Arabidopsis suecica]